MRDYHTPRRAGPVAPAAIISPAVGGWIIDLTGNWDLPFIGSIVLMLVGALLAFTMKPEQKL